MKRELKVTAAGVVEKVVQAMTLEEFCKASNQMLPITLLGAEGGQDGFLVEIMGGKCDWVPKESIPLAMRPKDLKAAAAAAAAAVRKLTCQEDAKQIVADYFNANVDCTDKTNITPDRVYIVWFCKTLQNWKALASTDVSDGMYYEITHNGDKDETYVDVYKKWTNYTVKRG